MNKKQEKKMLAQRTCACISLDHACEPLADFVTRVHSVDAARTKK